MTRTPLRDVITIPEQLSAGDYVLKLTEGVQDAAHARTRRSLTTSSRQSSPPISTRP